MAGIGPWLAFPEFEKKATARPGGLKGRRAIWIDEKTYENEWGVRHRLGEGDWYEEWISGPLQHAETLDDIKKYKFPTVKDIVMPENYEKRVRELKKQGASSKAGSKIPTKRRGYCAAWTTY
jgi:hypothetical protein